MTSRLALGPSQQDVMPILQVFNIALTTLMPTDTTGAVLTHEPGMV